jgi:histidinol phosphatase-like PHP family hydrolase
MIKIDLHMHSSWSDGEQTIREMLNACEVCGLQKVAITDHFRKHTQYKVADYRAAIDALRGAYPFEILVGAELEWDTDEGVDYFSYRDRSMVDLCLCELMGDLVFRPEIARYEQERREQDKFLETVFNTYCKIAEHPHVDVIAHPFNFGRMKLDFDFDLKCLPENKLYELAELMRLNNVAYELQSQFYYWYPKMRVSKLLNQQVAVAKIFKESGVRFSIGSDAHNVGTVGNHCWSESVLAGLGNNVKIIEKEMFLCA